MVTSLMAQSVSVNNVEALRGGTAKVTLVLNCPANTYSGLNFSIQFPETGFSVVESVALMDWNGAAAVGEMKNGKVKFSIASANAFSASTIVPVYFSVDNIDLGEYNAKVTDLKFDNKGTLVAADDVPFKVNVVDALTLDEESTTAPSAATDVDVIVKRTITGGKWNTICLPFAMTADQVKTAFGNDVKLGDFTGCTTETDAAKNVQCIKVNFSEVTAIEANHPYIIKVSSDKTEFRVNGVSITPTEELSVDMDPMTVRVGKTDVTIYNSFVGTYVANTEVAEDILFLNGGQFWYSKGNKMMKAFRGYFDFYDVYTTADESRISISFDDATGINNVKTYSGEGVYTLSGQRVKNAGKGVYIVNGKKVIKK